MALAAASFALQTSVDTIFKLLAAGDHPAWQLLFVNGCFALLPILAWSMMTGGLERLYTLRLPQHLVRGSISVMSAFAAIYAYSRLPLTDFYAIVFAGPLIVTALSAFWLGEKIEFARVLAIFAGFSGILIVANPFDAHNATLGLPVVIMAGRFAAFVSVFCYALSVIIVRRMRLYESSLSFCFYGYLAAITIGGTLLELRGAPPLETFDIAKLACSGILAGISSICLMAAYHRTSVSLVAPFQYTQIIWGAVAGYVLWSRLPDINLIIGAAVVAASGLFVIYREFGLRGSAPNKPVRLVE
jgi:drug/metabolite transporter (DMT)-like permease